MQSNTTGSTSQLISVEEQFLTVAEAAPVLLWISGTDMACYYFNQGWLNYTGRTLAQESGDGWTKGVHPDDLEKCLHVYRVGFAHDIDMEALMFVVKRLGYKIQVLPDEVAFLGVLRQQ